MGAKRPQGQAGRPSGPPAENVMGNTGGLVQTLDNPVSGGQMPWAGGLPGGGGGSFNTPWGSIPQPQMSSPAVQPQMSSPAVQPPGPAIQQLGQPLQPSPTPPPPAMTNGFETGGIIDNLYGNKGATPQPQGAIANQQPLQPAPAPQAPPPPTQMANPDQQTRPGGPPRGGIADRGVGTGVCPTCGK